MALPKIGDRFNGAVQKTAQENKIIELKEEIYQLRSNSQTEELELQINSLREQLELSGKKEIKVDLIDPNPEQPRQTIPASAITVKAHSLSKHGQITPIILIPQGNNRYLLLDGQLRWEAAKFLGWETIASVIVPMPEDLNHDSLLTFLQFEDLNPLDKAEAIVREVTKITRLESGEISTTLATVLKRIERDGKNKLLTQLVGVDTQEQTKTLASMNVSQKEQSLLMVLLDLGLNPGSVKANLLPMLSLPIDLKTAIRQQGLKGAHALAVATISSKALNISEEQASQERSNVTQIVLEQDLSVSETKALVTSIKQKLTPEDNCKYSKNEIANRISTIAKQLKQIKTLTDAKKQKKLERLLSEIEILISDN
jgi:ParB family chromosome partitioning protein